MKNPIDRLQFYIFVVCTVLVIVGCVLHFLGIMGLRRPVLLMLSAAWLCSDGTLLTLFLLRRVPLKRAFTLSCILSQAIESARIIYLSVTETISYQQFYINEFICFAILLLVIIGFFYKTALIQTFVNMLTLLICWPFIPQIINSMTISFFILLSIALCFYCFVSVSFVKQIVMENKQVTGKYNSFLEFMRMSDAEATSLIQLVRTAFDDEKHVDQLVAQLSDETKANLVNVANRIANSQMAKEEKIRRCFPQLSPTEVTVCQLVITGHSQKDIARIMDKTENNISTVRGNVRRKLNLETSQDLRTYLMESIKKEEQ